jgi:hypothetical protein
MSYFFIYNEYMSTWSDKKKRRYIIIIGLIFLIILGFIIIRATDTQPTCFDTLQNGTETGVDCGGECQRFCTEEARNLVVWWERPFKVAKGVFNVVAYVENQNLSAGIEEINYEFRLYNKDNILVGVPRTGTTFIEPNKRSAIFESGIETGEEEAFTVFFKTSSEKNWKRTDPVFSYGLFQVGEPVLINQDTAPKLSAPVENNTEYNFSDIPVVAVLYNQRGNAIAASQTYIDDITQGSTATVYFSWPEAFTDVVSRIEIIPRISPFLSRDELTR